MTFDETLREIFQLETRVGEAMAREDAVRAERESLERALRSARHRADSLYRKQHDPPPYEDGAE
jgi:hypothetical protein